SAPRVASIRLALLVDADELARIGVRSQEKVDEPGAGDLRSRDERAWRQRAGDRLREVPRFAPERLCEAQRDVRREISVLRVASALYRDDRRIDRHAGVICGDAA